MNQSIASKDYLGTPLIYYMKKNILLFLVECQIYFYNFRIISIYCVKRVPTFNFQINVTSYTLSIIERHVFMLVTYNFHYKQNLIVTVIFFPFHLLTHESFTSIHFIQIINKNGYIDDKYYNTRHPSYFLMYTFLSIPLNRK